MSYINQIKTIQKSFASLPATTQSAIFTVTGRILLHQIVGEVTTIIENQACNLKITANPTVGADVDLCANLDVDNDAVGTIYTITGDFSDALVETTSGAVETTPTAYSRFPILIAAGTIDLVTSATNTGSVKWTVQYTALDAGSTVTAA